MVILSNFPTVPDAVIVQGMLENNGIASVLLDENSIYVPVFGGVSLMVREEDLDRARELMKEHLDK